MIDRFERSEALLARALKTIPLGTQTFSKSRTQYPKGVSPFFIEKAKGSRVWDVDGNEYIDFINGLCSINLGYSDPDVDAAVKKQLESGIIFSLPHPIEIAVAEKLREMVPCAEMARFGKNGSDATSGAIRLARAVTKRDHVAVCGYHGWQDWYIGSTARNAGVPQAVRDLTHSFAYNDIDSLHGVFKRYPGEIAAVILEPMNTAEPKDEFLKKAQELARSEGALFVFDETITGFRLAKGGAQEYFGIVPDLATFGKGVANGYPLSVLAGKEKYMKLLEEVFFSFTFGGEALSLAASLAAMSKIQKEPVIETMTRRGEAILSGLRRLIEEFELRDVVGVSGHPAWSFLQLKDGGGASLWEWKTFFLQEMFSRGILILGSHNLSYAHSENDVARLLDAYASVFGAMKEAVDSRDLRSRLRCDVLQPLFRLR